VRARALSLANGDSTDEEADLAYFEWSAPDDADPLDRAQWAVANPALGIRIAEKTIAREQRAMDPMIFARERLGIWHDAGRYNIVDMAVWAGLADRKSQPVGNVVFGFDVTPDRSYSSIACYGKREDGAYHAEVIENRAGTGWLLPRLVQLQERWKPPAIIYDPSSQGGAIAQTWETENHSLPLETITVQQLGQACGAFVDTVVNGTLRHRDQVDLIVALTSATRRPLGDGLWAWNRKTAAMNIAPLVALTLAQFGFGKFGEPPKFYAAADVA